MLLFAPNLIFCMPQGLPSERVALPRIPLAGARVDGSDGVALGYCVGEEVDDGDEFPGRVVDEVDIARDVVGLVSDAMSKGHNVVAVDLSYACDEARSLAERLHARLLAELGPDSHLEFLKRPDRG